LDTVAGHWPVIDPSTRKKVGDISLKAHPRASRLIGTPAKIFVNLPDDRGIAVVDHVSQKQTGKWPLANRGANFPMALDSTHRHVLVIFRSPAELGVFAMTDGSPSRLSKPAATRTTCSSMPSAPHLRQLRSRLP